MSDPQENDRDPSRRAGPPWTRIFVSAALFLLAAGGATVYFVLRDQRAETDSAVADARQVAERFAVAFERARNEGARAVSPVDLRSLLCVREHGAFQNELATQRRRETTGTAEPARGDDLAIAVEDVSVSGDHGVVTLSGHQDGRSIQQDFSLVKEGTGWKVCGVYARRSTPVPTWQAPTTR